MTQASKSNTEDKQSPDELLTDLESIRQLLDEEPGESGAHEDTSPVPLLDDMLDCALTLKETPFTQSGSVADEFATDQKQSHPVLNEDLIQALLGDEWQQAASSILNQARGAIEADRDQWLPEYTDELNEALRVRIDATLNEWLRGIVRANLQELRSELLNAAEAVLSDTIETLLQDQSPPDTSDSNESNG